MQKQRFADKLQLIFVAILPLISSCGAGVRPIPAKKAPLFEMIENTKETDDPSMFLAHFAGEEKPETVRCREYGGQFSCRSHGVHYSSENEDDATYVDYEGSTKEGFIRKCFELEAPVAYFGFNDFLPFVKTIAASSEKYFNWTDYPSQYFEVDFDNNTDGYSEMFDFLYNKMPLIQWNDWKDGRDLFFWVRTDHGEVYNVSLEAKNEGKISSLFEIER